MTIHLSFRMTFHLISYSGNRADPGSQGFAPLYEVTDRENVPTIVRREGRAGHNFWEIRKGLRAGCQGGAS